MGSRRLRQCLCIADKQRKVGKPVRAPGRCTAYRERLLNVLHRNTWRKFQGRIHLEW
jgi:hypothetical protein